MNFTGRVISMLVFSVSDGLAKPELASIFTDHAVLQRDRPLPVWGKADPGEKVTVSLGTETASATTGADGRWEVKLPAQIVSTKPLTLQAIGKETVVLNDILLGDVWLCGGQSNMDLGLGGLGVAAEIAAADFPLIRSFRVGYRFSDIPVESVSGKWTPCRPVTAPSFSGVAYYFAKRVHAETGVPIGLLTNAVGGTNVELWISQEKLLGTPALESYAKTMRTSLADYQTKLRQHIPVAGDWVRRADAAAKLGNELPMPPERPEFPFSDRAMKPRCVTLHNGMVAPLAPFALRGVLWYQGENNADDGLIYVEKMKALIGEWRALFQNAELPFYYVQLPMWQRSEDKPEGGGWGAIRDAQRRCLVIPHTGMACAIDVGDADDLHPKNKEDVGNRLALWALHNEYGQKGLVTSGPLFKRMEVEDGKLRVHFDSIGGGLIMAEKKGQDAAVATPGAKLNRFAIAGEDRQWFWAEAVIDGETLLLSAPRVPHPVAVRYAYSSNPEGANLYNRAGLPAPPFRTDDW